MSAWICSYNHINTLVTWANKQGGFNELTPDQLGQLFWDENYKSVNYRYNQNDSAEPFTWSPFTAKTITPIDIIKLCQCLDYQSCEHDRWETSEAKKHLEVIKSAAIYKLPGYEDAPWGID